jgi:hypothetical protein
LLFITFGNPIYPQPCCNKTSINCFGEVITLQEHYRILLLLWSRSR